MAKDMDTVSLLNVLFVIAILINVSSPICICDINNTISKNEFNRRSSRLIFHPLRGIIIPVYGIFLSFLSRIVFKPIPNFVSNKYPIYLSCDYYC